jgi:hypothetical protein
MARYNSLPTATITSGAASVPTPAAGLVTTFTGTAPFQVTLPDPANTTGVAQMFYNSSTGIVTLATNSGTALFIGPGASGAATQTMARFAFYALMSDGTSYVLASNLGGAVSANTLTVTDTATISGLVTLNKNTNSSSAASGGTLTVTGGAAVSQDLWYGANLIGSGSGYFLPPQGSVANRPASPTSGMIRFNSDSGFGYLETWNGTSWGPVGGNSAAWYYQTITSNQTVGKFTWNWVKTATGAFTITLPASPAQGDSVKVVDVDINANSNNITIAGNGQNIQGSASNLTVSSQSAAFDLVYYNSSYGWRIIYI